MPVNRVIDSLDSRHLMSIIMFLGDNGPSRRTDIYEGVSRNANMPTKIGALIELGLVERGGTKDVPVFSLTPAGSAVADHLSSIESAICGTRN